MNISSSLLNKKLLTAFFAFLFLFVAVSNSNAQTASYVTITSPNGGEAFTEGDPVRISWGSNANTTCSLFYSTLEGGTSQLYYVGNASSSVGFFDWTAAKPLQSVSSQQEKIQIVCNGLPSDSSDDYFTVSSLNPTSTPTPTVTPTSTPTPTPLPICDKKATVSFVNTSTQVIHPGESVSNEFAVTNPNDPSCGPRLYGLSNSYPGGWSMGIQYSVVVNAGTTVNVPLTLTSPASASYQTYSYSVWAGDSSGGVLSGAASYVTVAPRCDATVQASLQNTTLSGFAGQILNNSLILTNPNPSECSAKTYVYSRSYPGSWSLNIQPNVVVASGQTVSVPFELGIGSGATSGSHNYTFWAYSAYADGSGQARVDGVVNVLDNIVPYVVIIDPSESTVSKRSTIAFNANASDNVGISKVEFYVNGELICTDVSASYSCSFNTVPKKNVAYSLMVKAYDAAGNVQTATSNVVTR